MPSARWSATSSRQRRQESHATAGVSPCLMRPGAAANADQSLVPQPPSICVADVAVPKRKDAGKLTSGRPQQLVAHRARRGVLGNGSQVALAELRVADARGAGGEPATRFGRLGARPIEIARGTQRTHE